MKLDTALEKKIAAAIRAENERGRILHEPSGKLSASNLGAPLQWQILRAYGVPDGEFDDYTLAKFKRGKDVEEWVCQYIEGDEQTKVEYRGVVGIMDKCTIPKDWDFPSVNEMPVEVKSVANAKFKRLLAQGEADRGHKLQGALYGLAIGSPSYAICYVASDDYRVRMMIYETSEMMADIDAIIDRFDAQKASGRVPAFEAVEKWQENEKYRRYPDWFSLTEEQATEKLQAFLATQ